MRLSPIQQAQYLGRHDLQQRLSQVRPVRISADPLCRRMLIINFQIHELTHILGFSAQMYTTYPTGNMLRT
jgi:hypothetical protein